MLYDRIILSSYFGSFIFKSSTFRGRVRTIPLGQYSEEDIEETIAMYQGNTFILFEGGSDINPRLYGEDNHFSHGNDQRDNQELLVYKIAMKYNIPVLGICRGHQFLNAVRGGTLYQDLAKQYRGEHQFSHELAINKSAKSFQNLMDTCPLNYEGKIIVNSLHHQGIKKLSESGMPIGYAPDGLIEAVEYEDGISVQYHPEFLNHFEFIEYMFDNYVR